MEELKPEDLKQPQALVSGDKDIRGAIMFAYMRGGKKVRHPYLVNLMSVLVIL